MNKQSMIDRADLVEKMASQSKALGTENLMNVLKNYARINGEQSK